MDTATSVTRTRDELSRDELIARGLPIVRRIVYLRTRWLPHRVDVDDLLGAAYERLLRHVAHYDPTRGAFDSFVGTHTRGALSDQMRVDDPLTRRDRKRANHIARATHQLRHELGRAPDETEVARRMGISLAELLTVPLCLEIEEAEADNPAPDARLFERERLRPLTEALSMVLAPRARWVVEQHYWHDRTQLDIGCEIGISESRVCQILSEATNQLRVAFEAQRAGKAVAKYIPRVTCQVGDRFGCWTVLSFSRGGRAYAMCRCLCGAVKEHEVRVLRKKRPDGLCSSCRWTRPGGRDLQRRERPAVAAVTPVNRKTRELEREAALEQMYVEIEKHGHVLEPLEVAR